MIIKKLFFIILILTLSLLYTPFAHASNAIITEDIVYVRNEPKNYSEILLKLKFGATVTIIKRSGKKEKINNNEGEWVYIDTNQYDYSKNLKEMTTLKGWVFDYYLSDFSKFDRITKLKFEKCIYSTDIGDVNFYYEFYKDGTFICKSKATYEGASNTVKTRKGTIHQYKRLILLRDFGSIFYINEDGHLCDIENYGEKNCRSCSECSKCKWE